MLDSNIIWWSVMVIVGTGVALCFALAVRIVLRGLAFLQVSTASGWNSDETAAAQFIGLLDEAATSMVVHDDGNKMEGSIYENEEVVDAVRRKLSDNRHFRLSCHFNFDASLRFTSELAGCDGVRIEVGNGTRPDDDIHYKIIDGGLKAHVSHHELDSRERWYKVIDCSGVPRRLLAHVTDVLLGRYKKHAMDLGVWVAP